MNTPGCTGRSPQRLQPYTKNYRQLRKIGSGRVGPSQGCTYQLATLCHRISPENFQETLYGLKRLYAGVYMYIQIHICIQ